MSRKEIKKKRQEKINHILKTAKTLFAKSGYARVSTNDIAKAAGISKRSMYYYTGVKEDLYRAIIDEILAEIIQFLKYFIRDQDHLSPNEKFFNLILSMSQTAKEDEAHSIMVREMLSGGKYVSKKKFSEIIGCIHANFADVLNHWENGKSFVNIDPIICAVMIQSFFFYWQILARYLADDPVFGKEIKRHGWNTPLALANRVYRIFVQYLNIPRADIYRHWSGHVPYEALKAFVVNQ